MDECFFCVSLGIDPPKEGGKVTGLISQKALQRNCIIEYYCCEEHLNQFISYRKSIGSPVETIVTQLALPLPE